MPCYVLSPLTSPILGIPVGESHSGQYLQGFKPAVLVFQDVSGSMPGLNFMPANDACPPLSRM